MFKIKNIITLKRYLEDSYTYKKFDILLILISLSHVMIKILALGCVVCGKVDYVIFNAIGNWGSEQRKIHKVL